MPELPEVETTKAGISPFVVNQTIEKVIIRETRLRFPITSTFHQDCEGQRILKVTRRAKYLLLHLERHILLIHLGMSGHLRVTPPDAFIQKHDHIDVCLSNQLSLRYHDPRRFGFWLIISHRLDHPMLTKLGPEPLTPEFNADYLFQCARRKTQSVKSFIMDNKNVVGVGNIYAAESLFAAKIHPQLPAGTLDLAQCSKLIQCIKIILTKAIEAGGTTLRDYYTANGKPGYFALALNVYGREGLPCLQCATTLQQVKMTGRSTVYCPICQPLSNPLV